MQQKTKENVLSQKRRIGIGLIRHKEAIELVKNNMLNKDIKIEADFDNRDYRRYVLSLGTVFNEFSPEEMDKIISFVKFMDLYENYEKNEKLHEYKGKLSKDEQLSNKELLD